MPSGVVYVSELLFQQTLVDAAGGQVVGLSDEAVHGAILMSGSDGQVDSGQQGAVALGDADDGAFLIIGDLVNNSQ